jgi:HlyD family secretion protein
MNQLPLGFVSVQGEESGAAEEDAGVRFKESCPMKRLLAILVILAAIAGSLYSFVLRNRGQEDSIIRISGNIEATEVNVGFKISGRVISLSAEEGDWIEKGKVIARIDDEDLRHRLDLARASLRASEARLAKLEAGSRPEELREAEALLNQAEYDLANKENHYERMNALHLRGVIPKETLDNSEAAFKIAKAALARAKESYALVKEGPRREDIEDARAQVEQARASLKVAETQLSYVVLPSPLSGVVLVKSAEVGEVVNAGTTVVTLADIENVWLRAYIPETELGRVKWGQEVLVKTDFHPRKEYRGRISFISSQAEFTPKQIQTEKERVTLVYRIKVDLSNPERELKPGMPADGRIVLSQPMEPGKSKSQNPNPKQAPKSNFE